MKIAILPCGPRGAGKTTYSHIVQSCFPEIEIISRDGFLITLYGNTILPVSHTRMDYINDLLIEKLKELVYRSNIVIVDYWNRAPSTRHGTIRTLRNIGFEKIVCWHFITPFEICNIWVQEKFDAEYFSEESYRRSYDYFYTRAGDVAKDDFDMVMQIDASQTFQRGTLFF